MKKGLFISLFALLLLACSSDDGPELGDFYFEYVPIENVVLPNVFQLGEAYTIEFSYLRPSTCHYFNGLLYDVNESINTIIVSNTVETGTVGCFNLSDELVTRTFVFSANNNTTYTFKFWQGLDDNNEDMYLQIDVPVIE